MSSQWKQFLELYAEKNPHLSKKQVLEMAKKPFQQLKQYYKQQGGQSRLNLFPICEEQITLDMLDEDEEEDKNLLEIENYPDNGELYNEFCEELQEIIIADCHGVVLNGKDVLYSYYDEMRSEEDEVMRKALYTDINKILLEDLIAPPAEDFFIDIYLFSDRWYESGDREFGPRKYHIEYNANQSTFNVSIFTKSKDSF